LGAFVYFVDLLRQDVSYNRIVGDLSAASYLGRLAALDNFDARRNSLTGPFPAWLRNVSATLTKFRIGLNQLRYAVCV
jgi:hypothetical protein